MSFYQIWIRSFADGNGDGIGDLYGVYDRLDYIEQGIKDRRKTCLWSGIYLLRRYNLT